MGKSLYTKKSFDRSEPKSCKNGVVKRIHSTKCNQCRNLKVSKKRNLKYFNYNANISSCFLIKIQKI